MNVFFHTFGCRANQYDTELVRQAFADQGATLVDEPEQADLAVVNSCTVTGASEAKLRTFVRQMARRGPGHARTVIMGCAAARDDGALARLPSVRGVVPGADPTAVLRAAGYRIVGRVDAVLRRFHSHARAWLKIQDGCDEHCTFCATTLARGANRSRAAAELVEEARSLAQHHGEVVLTGVHIGTYGKERRARGDDATAASLGALLELLIDAVPDVRFRLSSIEATEVDGRIAQLLIEEPSRLAAHLHAPLQSGSDAVLRRMGRHWYTAASYRARLEWLAERLPVFGLGADVMAGFSGESDEDHRATVSLIEALPFTYLHVFPFSLRPDVAAGRMGPCVGEGTVRRRAAELRALGDAKAGAYRLSRLGGPADGVVSGHRDGRVEVLTEDYLSVYLPAQGWDGRPRFAVTVN